MALNNTSRWSHVHTHRASVRPFQAATRLSRLSIRQYKCKAAAAAAPDEAEVVVVGAGIAGLSCAVNLQKQGVKPLVVESSDGVGGRVRTDVVDGFLLDRGFQIFLTGYPEAQSLLDYDALDLKPFYAGALVWTGSKFERVADPVRHLLDGLLSLTNPVGSVADKINVGIFRLKSLLGTWDELLTRPETSIEQRLRAEGFSESIIDQFFRPFLGGIFFDRSLGTSSRLFEFVMRTLALGSNCFPAKGIGAVSDQLAAKLPSDAVLLNTAVSKVLPATAAGSPARVVLASGQEIKARRGVVVAADAAAASALLGEQLSASPSKPTPGVGTCCLYYKAPRAPRDENILYLNGVGKGIVNNCCFPSTVAPSYAPAGQALVSVSTLGTYDSMSDAELFATVKQELAQWFGAAEVAGWQPVRLYRVPFAQPNQAPPTDFRRAVELGGGLFVCGDHRDSATLDGAIKSGRRAAEAVVAQGAVVAAPAVSV